MPTLYDDPMVLKALEMQGTPYNPTLEQNTQLQLDPTLQTLPDIGTPPGEQPPVTQVPAGQDPQMVQQALTLTQTPEEQVPPTGNTPPEPTQTAPAGSAASAYEAIQALDQTARERASSAQQMGEATAEGYQLEADARKQAVADNDAQIAAQAKQRKMMDDVYSEGMAQFKAANEAAKALPPPKDNRSNMQRLMGAVAVGMGAASDGFAKSGGMQQNYAGEIQAQINTVIERDIQAQREAIANKRADAQSALSELGVARNYFSDTQQADQFARILTTERTANQLGVIAANTKHKESKAAILGAQAGYKADVAKQKLDLYKSVMSKKLNPYQAQLMGLSPTQAAQYNNSINAEEGITPTPDFRTKPQKGADSKEAGEADIPGYHRTMSDNWYTSDRTKKANDLTSATSGVVRLGNRLASKFDAVNNAKTKQEAVEARTDYITARESYLSSISVALEQGVITKSDAERMEGAVPPPPPANWYEAAKQGIQNAWQGTEYSSRAIRAYGETLETLTEGKLEAMGYARGNASKPQTNTRNTPPTPQTPKEQPKAKKPKGFEPG